MLNKKCSKCKQIKSINKFYTSLNTKDKLFSWCKECCKQHQKKYKEYNRKHSMQYRKDHPEKRKQWRDKNKEYLKNYEKERYKKDPERVKFYSRLRKARIKGSIGSYSREEWEDLKYFCNYKCLVCERKEPNIKLTPDHIIPISKGGNNTILNILPLCLECNLRKSCKDEKWYIEQWIKIKKEKLLENVK